MGDYISKYVSNMHQRNGESKNNEFICQRTRGDIAKASPTVTKRFSLINGVLYKKVAVTRKKKMFTRVS